MSYIYIGHPYSHKDPAMVLRRYKIALEAAAYFISRGEVVYSPILHSHECAREYDLPTDYRFWEPQNEAMLKASSLFRILDLPGLNESKGTAREICWCNQWGKPIEIFDPSIFKTFRYYSERGLM